MINFILFMNTSVFNMHCNVWRDKNLCSTNSCDSHNSHKFVALGYDIVLNLNLKCSSLLYYAISFTVAMAILTMEVVYPEIRLLHFCIIIIIKLKLTIAMHTAI